MANNKFWYARNWSDYQDKTRHLTLAQHGAYVLLLDYYYSRDGEVQAIATDLLRVCSSRTTEEDDAITFILDNFFSVKDGKYVNDRADKEMKIARKVSAVRKVAGSKGGSKKVANMVAKRYTDTDTDTDTVTDTIKHKNSRNNKTPVPPGFNLTPELIAWGKSKSVSETKLNEHMENFINQSLARDYRYVDWNAAFRNAVKANWAKLPEKREPKKFIFE